MTEEDCKCTRISGHLEAVRWLQYPRHYKPSAGYLSLGDWTSDPHIWLHYVESSDGLLAEDDVLLTTDTRYWSIHDVQRYFFGDLHCEKVLFTYQYPNLRMPTRLGSYFWRANTALKRAPALYQKEFNRSLEITLKNMEATEAQMSRLIVSDQLIKIDFLDDFKRKTFFRILNNIISFQDRLELVSLENLCCKRLEGVRLVQQLSCFNANTLKYLFLWRFVLPNENPLLINYSYITGSGQYIPRPETRHCFLRSLGELRNLRVLALEYSHIADGSGSALISLLPVIKRPHFRLQAIRIRDYDNIRRFLVPSIPLREVHLQHGIDLKMKQRQDSDLSCFIRHVAYRYANTLVSLSIHQWRFAVFPLRRIFELMPRLVRFHYIGRVEDDIDLRRMLLLFSCGICDKLKQINIQIQDEESKREYWRQSVDSLTSEFSDIIKLFNITFCINIYKT